MKTSQDKNKYIVCFNENDIETIRIENEKSNEILMCIWFKLGEQHCLDVDGETGIAVMSKRDNVQRFMEYNKYLIFDDSDLFISTGDILLGCQNVENYADYTRKDIREGTHPFKGLTINELETIFNQSFINFRKITMIDWFAKNNGIKLSNLKEVE